MDLRDLYVIKDLVEKYETSTKLNDKEEILKEKVNLLLAFEEVQNKYTEDRKDFQTKMDDLNKKAGE